MLETCHHCGNKCEGQAIYEDEHAFCCSGCVTVHHLLKENGLQDFYAIGTGKGNRPKGEGRYAWLEDPQVVDKLLEYQDEKQAKVSFSLPDMHCAACIWLLEQLYRIQPGILRSEVDFPHREISLHYHPAQISLREVVELLDVLGYPPRITLADAEGEVKPRQDRRRWYRLGIAGFCFGNIMLLSFPEYLGVSDPRLAQVFQWLNLALILPVLHSAGVWFRSAWKGLRRRDINMDVPIALGISVLFIRSGVDVITGAGPGYFDSLAGLVFFLLIGRWYQDKSYHLLSFDRDFRSYFPISVTRLQGSREEEQVQIADLKAGDRIWVRHGELIPADGILVQGQAKLDYSFVTGENDPVERLAGEKIYAGARVAGKPAEIALEKEVSQAYLTRLWNHAAFRKEEKAPVVGLSQQVARWFTPAVILIALVAGVYWSLVDSSQVWNVVTSVLIVACPCALALSAPFALGNLVRVFGKRGFFLKNHASLERMAHLDHIVFDKTGTMTHAGASGVQWEGEALSAEEQAAVRALLGASVHPLSRRVHASLPHTGRPIPEQVEEVKGKGLFGVVGCKLIQLGRADWVKGIAGQSGGPSEVWVKINGQLKGHFVLRESLRAGIAESVADLQDRFQLALLSGDQDFARARLSPLFPPQTPLHFRQSPHDKLAYVADLQARGHCVAMVGDGLNDAGALQQSDLGIAVTDELAAFTPASDGILEGRALRHLPRFLRLARQGRHLILASFGISFLYNLLGMWFAVQGLLSPLVAAILMPLSSVTIIAFATLGVSVLARRSFPLSHLSTATP